MIDALDPKERFRVEALAIGDELLDGRVADTNTLRLAVALADLGLAVAQRTTVTDDIEAIVREARAVAARGTKLCVVSGGLGPTRDDLTSEAFAQLLGTALVRDHEQVLRIEERLGRRGRPVTDNQRKQADRPASARVIFNAKGTAPGFMLSYEGCVFIATPGVPSEFDAMIADAVVAPLAQRGEAIEKRSLYSFGLTEGEVDALLTPLAEKFPQVRVGFRAHMPEIHVSLSAAAPASEALAGALSFTRQQLGAHVYTETKQSFAAALLEKLRARGATLALAESCTGGLIGDLITDVPGSSAAFLGGFVVYANTMKEDLGVPADLLREHGAVSEPVALAMAERARAHAHATYALAVSGIAGPDGGTPDKPVGTTCIALVSAETSIAKTFHWPFDRRRNKLVSAYTALDMLRRLL